jgi:hypothetical protein
MSPLSRSTRAIGMLAPLLAACLLSPMTALASSHREAPLISADPLADNTDVYAFVSPDNAGTVTLIADFVPFEEPAGGPNFYKFGDDILYEIHVDNDGDALPDISYQFRFKTTYQNKRTFLYNTGPINSLTDPNFNIRQTYTVTKVEHQKSSFPFPSQPFGNGFPFNNVPGFPNQNFGNGGDRITVLGTDIPVPPNNIGPRSTPNYANLSNAAIRSIGGNALAFAGQMDDPFFVELGGLFDLLAIRQLPGNNGGGVDGLKGYNTQAIALQVPIEQLTKNRNRPTNVQDPSAVIGVWSTTSRPAVSVLQQSEPNRNNVNGPWVQVSRLGAPLVNEVVIPLESKDQWNYSQPKDDAQFAQYVANPELGGLLHAIYNIAVPPQGPFGSPGQRDDLISIFLTGIKNLTQPANVKPSEELRLNVAVAPSPNPNRLGVVGGDVQGYPNGRRLADDVTDISIKAVAGAAYPLFHPTFTPDPLAAQLGDGVDFNDKPFRPSFPYLALPSSGFSSVPHP